MRTRKANGKVVHRYVSMVQMREKDSSLEQKQLYCLSSKSAPDSHLVAASLYLLLPSI